jgi:hypothetical protein
MRIPLFALVLFALPAWADEGLWDLLEKGGQVVLIRHALTEPGTGDPPGFRPEDCATQRNLSDAGRAHARRIGDAFRKRQIPVSHGSTIAALTDVYLGTGEMVIVTPRGKGAFAVRGRLLLG